MSQFDAIRGDACAGMFSRMGKMRRPRVTRSISRYRVAEAGKPAAVKVQAQNFQDATQFIRQNWPIIETMAREELAKGCRHIELAAP